MPRLQQYYREKVVPRLTQELGLKNPMQVPIIDKVIINMGIGEAVADRKKVESAASDLANVIEIVASPRGLLPNGAVMGSLASLRVRPTTCQNHPSSYGPY